MPASLSESLHCLSGLSHIPAILRLSPLSSIQAATELSSQMRREQGPVRIVAMDKFGLAITSFMSPSFHRGATSKA